ncbi:MAG: DUF3575 domain-containing protein [Winogradskyella sp.]|nr:DUF3575 domain-containing protein [Winogradskyella sp.]
MKKSILAAFLLCATFTLNAQEQNTIDNPFYAKHEVKLNALVLVLGAFEVGYEYLLDDESGLGISVFLPYDKELKDEIQYYISPYYRYYFGKKHAAGFFLEGFGMLNRADRNIDFLFEDDEDNWVTDFALGIGLGGKWVTKKGLTGEINFGIGRNLFESEGTDYDFVGKFGITVGYRF